MNISKMVSKGQDLSWFIDYILVKMFDKRQGNKAEVEQTKITNHKDQII